MALVRPGGSVMMWFGKKKDEDDEPKGPVGPPRDPKWVKSPVGGFFKLAILDPEELGLSKVGGVYVVWHAGVRPRYVIIGNTEDLAGTFHNLGRDDEIMYYDRHGGLYVTWAFVRDKVRPGVVRYLEDVLKPLFPTPSPPKKGTVPVAVFPPGYTPPGEKEK